MVPGTILFDRNFRFRDGKRGEKLFVVLNDARNGAFIVVKTTSQDARYTLSYGCQITHRFPHFYLPAGSCCLDGHTWLCMDEYFELDRAKLHERLMDARIVRIGVLTPEITSEVQGCAISSFDITEAQAQDIREVWLEAKGKAKSNDARAGATTNPAPGKIAD
jgi:hypothetical protein